MMTDYSNLRTIDNEESLNRMLVKNRVLGGNLDFCYKGGVYEMRGSNILLKKVLIENGSFEIPEFVTGLYKEDKYVSPFIDCVSLKVTNKSQITELENLFAGSKLKELDLSEFDASKSRSLEGFLSNCNELHTVNLTGFTTGENLCSLSHFFSGCKQISSLDLNSFTTDNVLDFSYMFEGCNRLSEFVLTSGGVLIEAIIYPKSKYFPLTIKKGVDFRCMFKGTKALKKLAFGDCEGAWTVEKMFENSNIKSLDMKYFKCGRNFMSSDGIFSGCKYLHKVTASDPVILKEAANRTL